MRTVLLLALLAPLGCEEPLGHLSPATVDAVTKTVGDSEGFDRSGLYLVDVTPIDCPCDPNDIAPNALPMAEGLAAFSLCEAVMGFPGASTVEGRVVATNGVITIEVSGAMSTTLVGPLYLGGRFSAGAVTTVTSFVGSGRLVTRTDGDFDRVGDVHEFEATLDNRIAGTAIVEDSPFDVDCIEKLELSGRFAQPL